MKNLRKFSAAVVLTIGFALPTFAGVITTMVTEPPPPPDSSPEVSGGDTTMGVITTGSNEGVALTETALNLLQSALALF